MANIYDMADTWNDSGTVFTAIKMNVTDTASDADSLLMDLQVGGTSQISASKGGEFRANSINLSGGSGGTSVGESLIFGVHHSINYELNSLTFRLNTKQVASFRAFSFKGLSLNSDSVVTWTSGADAVGTNDLYLYRDAADTLAQRRSTNPQEFRLYNTYTNSTDYERGFMRWNSNVLEIGTEADGTGTDRAISFEATAAYFDIANTRRMYVGSGEMKFQSSFNLQWSSGTNIGLSSDVGIARNGAGVLRVSDGSTGTGELIFIVPTSDPGISGALWNNGGTLAISA